MCLLLRMANTSKLKSMSAHCSLHPVARKAAQFWAIKELVWLRQHSQTLTRELLCLRSYDSATEPPQFKGWKEQKAVGDFFSPARGPTTSHQKGWCHSHTHHNLGIEFASLQRCFRNPTPALKPTNVHFWKHYHTNLRIFSSWVSTTERQFPNGQQVALQGRSRVRRGLSSINHR